MYKQKGTGNAVTAQPRAAVPRRRRAFGPVVALAIELPKKVRALALRTPCRQMKDGGVIVLGQGGTDGKTKT